MLFCCASAPQIAKRYNDNKTLFYRVQRPYQISTNIWPSGELEDKYRPATSDEVRALLLNPKTLNCKLAGMFQARHQRRGRYFVAAEPLKP